MPNRLSAMRILRLSLVKSPATRKRWHLMKSERAGEIAIVKADEDRRLLYGTVYSPHEIDSQDDYADALEIELAAHQFLKDMRDGSAFVDVNHDDRPADVDVVESYIAPATFAYDGGGTVTKGSWVAVVHARTPEAWQFIKDNLQGFSMAGHGKRTVEAAAKSTGSMTDDEYVADVERRLGPEEAQFVAKALGVDRTGVVNMDDFERLAKVDDAVREVPSNRRIRRLLGDWLVKHINAQLKDPSYEYPEGFRTVYSAHRLMVSYNMSESPFTPLVKSASSIPDLAAKILDQI